MVENINSIFSLLLDPELLKTLSPEIVARISELILILKTAGIVLIIYVLFLIVSAISNLWRNHRIKLINKKVDEINEKLDKLIEKDKFKNKRIKK